MTLAAGSAALRPLLAGPRRPATVVEALASAVYLETSPGCPEGAPGWAQAAQGAVVAVVARDAVRVPVAVAVPEDSSARPFAGVRIGAAGWVGDGGVALPDGRSWRVLRWWDPSVPAVRVVAPALDLDPGLDPGLERRLDPGPGLDLHERALLAALADGSPAGLDAAVAGLVGRGPGLTPEGDDVLAGALVAFAASGSPLRDLLARAVEACLTRPGRTTTVSAALLRCAVRGLAIPPLTAFVVSGDPAGLLAVGHTSGAALARGVELAMLADSTRRTKEAA